jgi:hypothetical protein
VLPLAIVAAVVVLLAVLGGLAAAAHSGSGTSSSSTAPRPGAPNGSADPVAEVRTYLGDVEAGNYVPAFALLCPAVQAISEGGFAGEMDGDNALYGPITSYQVGAYQGGVVAATVARGGTAGANPSTQTVDYRIGPAGCIENWA